MLFIMSQYLSCHRHWDEAKRLPKKCSWLSIQRNQQVTTTTHIIMFVDTHRMCEDDTKSAQWTCNCFTTTTKTEQQLWNMKQKKNATIVSLQTRRAHKISFSFFFTLGKLIDGVHNGCVNLFYYSEQPKSQNICGTFFFPS